MRFQSAAVAAIAALSATVCAEDVNSSNLAKFSSDFQNYLTATLEADPAFQSDFISLATDTAGLADLESIATNLPAVVTDSAAMVSSILAALPTEGPIKGLITSIIAVEHSIAIADGVESATTTGSANSSAKVTTSVAGAKVSSTESSSSAKPSSTGSGATRETIERGLLAGSLIGVVGLMAAL